MNTCHNHSARQISTSFTGSAQVEERRKVDLNSSGQEQPLSDPCIVNAQLTDRQAAHVNSLAILNKALQASDGGKPDSDSTAACAWYC